MKRFDPGELPAVPDLKFETGLWQAGMTLVAGIDEAGRGAWAGPVTAAAVILPCDLFDMTGRLRGVRDSKQMTALQRERCAERIRGTAASWAVGWASGAEIDALGIVPATRLAMQRAVEGLAVLPQHLLVDAVRLPGIVLGQTALIKGDARALSIAAASVLAKTARDAWMRGLDAQYPGYGFAAHKGYGTAAHQHALTSLGACAEHRASFAPVRAVCESAPLIPPIFVENRGR